MAANGINILGAQINTGKKGKVLDILQVNSAGGFLITDEKRWLKVETDLQNVLQGRLSVEQLIAERKLPGIRAARQAERLPTFVKIDNEVSEDYTVIDVYAQDRVGLLYLIANRLNQLGLYIDVARVSTRVNQVADTFYLKNSAGQKIIDPDTLDVIKNSLVSVIGDRYEPLP
jgi:[protein-PII] uridylyltransferase